MTFELFVAGVLVQALTQVVKTLPGVPPLSHWQKFAVVALLGAGTNLVLVSPSWRSWLFVVAVAHISHSLLRLAESATDLLRVKTLTSQRLTARR